MAYVLLAGKCKPPASCPTCFSLGVLPGRTCRSPAVGYRGNRDLRPPCQTSARPDRTTRPQDRPLRQRVPPHRRSPATPCHQLRLIGVGKSSNSASRSRSRSNSRTPMLTVVDPQRQIGFDLDAAGADPIPAFADSPFVVGLSLLTRSGRYLVGPSAASSAPMSTSIASKKLMFSLWAGLICAKTSSSMRHPVRRIYSTSSP